MTFTKRFYTRGIAYTENYGNNQQQQLSQQMPQSVNVDDEMSQFHAMLYNSNPANVQQQQMGNIFGAPPIGAAIQSLDSNFANYPQPFDIKTEMGDQPMTQHFNGEPQALVENNSIRNKPLDPDFIDSYLKKNVHRLYSCRKCKINFPHREYLQRHMAFHEDFNARSYTCNQCPQRFTTEKQLESHLQRHADDSPHRCFQCNGGFRSALTLRRHRDQCRQCYCPTFGYQQQQQMISPNAVPLDQYAFIDSDLEEDDPLKNLGLNRQKSTTDSGMGSDSSTYTTSPISNRTGMEDELDINGQHQAILHHQNPTFPLAAVRNNSKSPVEKKVKNDETDSGFRSRLNSTTQSCSPGSSSFSSESEESPNRKFSKTGLHHPHEQPMHPMASNEYNAGTHQYNAHHSGTTQHGYAGSVYHPHQQMSGQTSIKYEPTSGNTWSTSGWQSYNDSYRRFEFGDSSDGVSLLMLPMEKLNLSGKATFVDRFELLNVANDDVRVEDCQRVPPNQAFEQSDVEALDGRDVVEEAVRLFAK